MSYTHHAVITIERPPFSECGEAGRCVVRMADVDCPDCLQLDADRQARAEIHDGHAIPASDEPDLVTSLAERVEQLERIVAELSERLANITAQEVMAPSEVSDMLGINPKTLVSWAKSGRISCINLPSGHRRYLRAEVEAFLNRSRTAFEAYQTPKETT